MTRHQSRPKAGAMEETIWSKSTKAEKEMLLAKAQEMDRTLSWLVRDALIKSGYLPTGR